MTIRARDSLLRVRVFSDIWCVDAFDAGFEIRNRQSDKPNHPRTIIPTKGGPLKLHFLILDAQDCI